MTDKRAAELKHAHDIAELGRAPREWASYERESFDAMSERIKREMRAEELEEGIIYGDCVACDCYILHEAEKPYCPTCARLRREAQSLEQDGI